MSEARPTKVLRRLRVTLMGFQQKQTRTSFGEGAKVEPMNGCS
jgi:hypothetical protein